MRVVGLGALCGAAFAAVQIIPKPGFPLEYYVGGMIGGLVAGAVLFGLVAGLRNLVVRAR